MTDRPTLIAVAHGSAEPAAARTYERLMDRVRVAAPDLDARVAYVDHVGPSVRAALAEVAGRPCVVVPLLLAPGAHAKGDIPGSIDLARRPGWSPTYGRVLGPHRLLTRALDRSLTDSGAGPASAVVLAAAGSADPDGNAEVARAARLLWEWRGGRAPVEAAFASATGPRVEEVIDRFDRLGHTDVAVASYFLAPGRLPAAVARAAGERPVTAPLADTDEVASVLLERYADAVEHSAPASCDVCVYRAAWPGHEHRVGQPRRAHPHPAD